MTTLTQEGNSGDVSATLGELERKLRELEQELARVGHPAGAAPAAPPVAPPASGPVVSAVPPIVEAAAPPAAQGAPVRLAAPGAVDERRVALEEQLDLLRRYGDELQASAGRLLEAYHQALADLESTPMTTPSAAAAPAAPTGPPPTPARTDAPPAPPAARPPAAAPVTETPVAPAPPLPPAVPAQTPFATRAPIGQGQQLPPDLAARFAAAEPPEGWAAVAPEEAPTPLAHEPVAPASPPAPAPLVHAGPAPTPAPGYVVPAAHAEAVDQTYLGVITVDAGPFVDIASLSEFEQALARVPGVRDVYVRGFQGQRVIIDVDFGAPTVLIPELAAASPIPFTVNGADATGLVVTIHSAAAHG